MLRIHHCNTGYHGNVLIGYLTFLQMICLIQAFRGRNLPGLMNDSMVLVYTIFIITMSFAVTIPIVFFVDKQDGNFVHSTALLINSATIVSFLYGRKVLIMIFQPRKNTKAYFNAKSMENMAKTVGLNQQE